MSESSISCPTPQERKSRTESEKKNWHVCEIHVPRPISGWSLREDLFVIHRCQFFDLATNDDGSVVYFATKHSRVGENEPYHGRIFRIRDGELQIVESREVEPSGNSNITENCSNFFDLQNPVLSGDNARMSLGEFFGVR